MTRGQLIARIGRPTAFSPHLHFEMRKDVRDLFPTASDPNPCLYPKAKGANPNGYYSDANGDVIVGGMTATQVSQAYGADAGGRHCRSIRLH